MRLHFASPGYNVQICVCVESITVVWVMFPSPFRGYGGGLQSLFSNIVSLINWILSWSNIYKLKWTFCLFIQQIQVTYKISVQIVLSFVSYDAWTVTSSSRCAAACLLQVDMSAYDPVCVWLCISHCNKWWLMCVHVCPCHVPVWL